MNTIGAILIIIGVLGIMYSLGLLAYKAGQRHIENLIMPKSEPKRWSKKIDIWGFRIIICKIRDVEGKK